MAEEKCKQWEELISSIDFSHNSRIVWKTISKLSNDPTKQKPIILVTANHVAPQILLNGRGNGTKAKRPHYNNTEGETLMTAVTDSELYTASM